MATNASAITTAEQLWAANLEQPCELIQGELHLMSPAGDYHCAAAGNIAQSLGAFNQTTKQGRLYIGEPGYILERNPDTVRSPDLAFVSKEKLARHGRTEKFMPYAPDLVVEVVSPSDSRKYVEEKTAQWLAAGCQMVIVVNPRRRIVEQHLADGRRETLDESGTIDGGEVVPGWRLPVSEVFEE